MVSLGFSSIYAYILDGGSMFLVCCQCKRAIFVQPILLMLLFLLLLLEYGLYLLMLYAILLARGAVFSNLIQWFNTDCFLYTSIASLKKKRKQQDSQPGKHLAKHVCREKVEGDEPARGCESDPESTNSNSFHSNYADSFMCSDDEDQTRTSDELAASSASWAATSSGASPYYSSENRSFLNSSTREPESLSMNMNEDQHDQHDAGFGWEGHAEIELYTDKELEDLLYSNGAAPGGTFILSSGRWSVDQGENFDSSIKLNKFSLLGYRFC